MKDLNRKEALQFLLDYPYLFGHMIGFHDLTQMHNNWMRSMILGEEDETLQAHRGSYKTTCVSIALAVIMVVYPNDKTMFMRKTDQDVKEVLIQVKNILLSPVMQELARRIYVKNLILPTSSATAITTNLVYSIKGTAQLVGIGTKSSLTGKHFDRIFTDDIVNVEDRVSRAERERTKLVYQELQNIKNRGGRIINTGTPWHKDDCFALMPNPHKFTWKDTGLISEDEAEEIRAHMTNSLFAANYELKHIAEDDVIFGNPQTGADASLVLDGMSHCDAAFYGEDYTALTIMGIHDGKFYVFGKCWRKHIDSVMDEIIVWCNKFRCRKMYNELNADKGYVANEFKKRGLRVVRYNEKENKYIKIVSYLKFEWKNVVFVKGTDQEYIDQICEYNENASHDDCPDSLASLIRALGKKASRSGDNLTERKYSEFL